MGWLEGLLTGYVDRHHAIEKEKMDEAVRSQEQEAKVYQALLNADDPELRQMAGAGMLDMANPLRKTKGLKGWMGEVQRSPMLPLIRKYMQEGKTTTEQVTPPGLSSVQHTGYQLPPGQDPAEGRARVNAGLALPAESPTEAGAPPITAPVPTPGRVDTEQFATMPPPPPPGGPPQPPVDTEALAAAPPPPVFNDERQMYQAPEPFRSETTETPPGPPPAPPGGMSIRREVPGEPATFRDVTTYPHFPTTEDIQAGTYLGRGRGEYESAVQMFRRAGDPNPEQKAAEFMVMKEMRAGGVPRQGTEYERMLRTYAQRTYNRAVEQLTDQEFEHVQELARQDLEERSFSRTTGTGRAQVNTELNKPIGVVAGRELNLPATTPLRDLDKYVLLDQAQKQRLYQVNQVEQNVRVIDEMLPKVFPQVEPGVWGKLETAFSLGGQWITGSADLAKLDAAIKLAMSNITRIAGETGNLAASDVARAEAALASLTPAVFGGDTLLTAQARVSVVHELLKTAKTVSPGALPLTPNPTTTPNPNAAANPAAAGDPSETPPPGVKLWTSPSGKVYVNGKLVSR